MHEDNNGSAIGEPRWRDASLVRKPCGTCSSLGIGTPIVRRGAPYKPHMMRAMLVSNLSVEDRFANGTQGKLLHWHPPDAPRGKAVSASHPELLARFAKETALQKREMFPDVDHMDVTVRQETLTRVPGQPVMLQLPVVPSYALTVHKVGARLKD